MVKQKASYHCACTATLKSASDSWNHGCFWEQQAEAADLP
jgi:hypothetical protein